jgi:hypothetical protein
MKRVNDVIGGHGFSATSEYQSRDGCVKLRAPLFQLKFSKQDQEALWLITKNAKTHRALANLSPAQSIAARRAKVPATQSSLIAIAVTKSVREISSRDIIYFEQKPDRERRCYLSGLV